MTSFVLDSSITLSWFFEDERTEATDQLLERLDIEAAAVPALWHFEVANVLTLAERRGRAIPARVAEFAAELKGLAIIVDAEPVVRAFDRILSLARGERLTAYDASYLELAMRLGLPLATKDHELAVAAQRLGVTVLGED